jgi:membrane protein DedA with SNARE-associated domain
MVFVEIANFIMQVIASSGYFGVFFLMILESAVMPVPSEIIMPFAGFLVSTGQFNIWYIVLAGSLGNVVGALIAYFVGLYLGRGFILRYGKYILLEKKYILMTENWFKKYGEKTVFFCRMMPIVRTINSLPAGIGKMNLKKFVMYTFLGSIPWNLALTYVGVVLGKNWNLISNYSHLVDILVVSAIVIFIVWFVFSHRRKKLK